MEQDLMESLVPLVRLAGLRLTEEELARLAPRFQQMRAAAQRLNELPLAESEPAHIFRPQEGQQ